MTRDYEHIRNSGLNNVISMYEKAPEEVKLELEPMMYCIGHFVELTDRLNELMGQIADIDDFLEFKKLDDAFIKCKKILDGVKLDG